MTQSRHTPYLMEIFAIIPPTLDRDSCIQHHQADLPEIHLHFRSKILPFLDLADIHGVFLDAGIVVEGGGVGFGQELGVVVDEGEFHAMVVAELRDGEADAGGGACD